MPASLDFRSVEALVEIVRVRLVKLLREEATKG